MWNVKCLICTVKSVLHCKLLLTDVAVCCKLCQKQSELLPLSTVFHATVSSNEFLLQRVVVDGLRTSVTSLSQLFCDWVAGSEPVNNCSVIEWQAMNLWINSHVFSCTAHIVYCRTDVLSHTRTCPATAVVHLFQLQQLLSVSISLALIQFTSNMSVCLPGCLCVCLSVCLCVLPYVCVCLSVCCPAEFHISRVVVVMFMSCRNVNVSVHLYSASSQKKLL